MSTEPARAPEHDVFRCPACGGGLAPSSSALACTACAVAYPRIGDVPWLVPQPALALSQWRGRCQAMLAQLERQAATYRSHLAPDLTRALTRSRLKLLASACEDHARRLRALLAPLLGEEGTPVAAAALLEGAASASGNPLAYYANVHRDWAWGDDENQAQFEAVRRALAGQPVGRALVLGAGAGRLAYDLHEQLGPSRTIAADVNPLLVAVAQRMYQGRRLELYEFPVAPRNLASHALLRPLAAPRAARAGLELVYADARRTPFASQSFETVVTPWLVDVVDADLPVLAAEVNRLLAPGGRWLCTGTLNFEAPDPRRAYATEEVGELVVDAGFEPPRFDERVLPYLVSPASRHARHEAVVTFAVAKRSEAECVPLEAVAWRRDPHAPVPLLEPVAQRTLALRVEGYVASLVDGRRSTADIAARLVQERLLAPADAVGVVRDFLVRLHASAGVGGES